MFTINKTSMTSLSTSSLVLEGLVMFWHSLNVITGFSTKNTAIKFKHGFYTMDKIVDSLERAYEEFVEAGTKVLEEEKEKEASNTSIENLEDSKEYGLKEEEDDGSTSSRYPSALENLKEKSDVFKGTCDQAEAFVTSMKQKIISESGGRVKQHIVFETDPVMDEDIEPGESVVDETTEPKENDP
ncbi:hypothetical protein Fmac_002801 [Flemingia macrophylla]|uniref:Uncharacterized protein n=1 Tax=Flemingia macrophylla TaxID=520843 RepID=A0ABD1NL43_9FABA